jgi:hypothetical protein
MMLAQNCQPCIRAESGNWPRFYTQKKTCVDDGCLAIIAIYENDSPGCLADKMADRYFVGIFFGQPRGRPQPPIASTDSVTVGYCA